MAFAAVLTVMHCCHKDTSTTFRSRAFPPQTLNFAIAIDLVIFEHSQLGLLALMLDLLWRGVNLLLALLGATAKSEDEMEG